MSANSVAGASVAALQADRLYRASDLSKLPFSTTAELQPIGGLVGQSRVLEAIKFGTQVDKAGFNLFVIGRSEDTRLNSSHIQKSRMPSSA